MRSVDRNFSVTMVPCERFVTKVGDPANPHLAARARQEQAALTLVTAHCPEIVPISRPIDNEHAVGVKTERLVELGRVSVGTMLETIDRLQTIPPSDTLPTYDEADYHRRNELHVRYLHLVGGLCGLTTTERNQILARSYYLREAISPFSTVFVHTDVQKRHFGRSPSDHQMKLFDFDQAHFGNELEDYAFLSVRGRAHKAVLAHLEARFADDPKKQLLLPGALQFMENYFLLKGVVDRTVQSRSRPFDVATRAYGRMALFARTLP